MTVKGNGGLHDVSLWIRLRIIIIMYSLGFVCMLARSQKKTNKKNKPVGGSWK